MNITRNRIHSVGFAIVLTLCVSLTVALMLRVNAVKGQVREAESRIVALKHDIQFLEVEFQTRANQQQLATLNAVEFGYRAPSADQYLEDERQLAALGLPPGPNAPRPIRMVNAVGETEAVPFIAMVSPVGEPAPKGPAAAAPKQPAAKSRNDGAAAAPGRPQSQGRDLIGDAIAEAALGTRLARIEFAGGADE